MTEPTALSKIIPVNLDFNSSSSLNWKPFNTGRAFWTKDIGTAFLEFSTELDLTGTVASIVLENQYDKSLVQKTISGITASPFYYQLGDEIQHDGRWFVQISVTKGEETIVSNSFAFMVNASIGHGKVARLISIETFETLATQLTLLQTSINDYLTTAQESESIRVSTYEEVVLAEQERKDAEDTRKAISMADHSTAQSDHSTAQTDHTTATADHGIAVTDHTTAVSDHSISQSDHSISLTDHTTATADHGIAVTDHIVAVADHASYEGLLTDGVLTTNIENTLKNLESTYAPELLSVKQQLEQKATKIELSAVASGSPKGVYATLSALQTAKPTGDTNIYVVSADGNWYYWNGSAWTSGGMYQSAGIADKSIVPVKTSFFEIGKNRYNNSDTDIQVGRYVADGTYIVDANYFTTGYIATTPNEEVRLSANKRSDNTRVEALPYSVSVYDQSKTRISTTLYNNTAPFRTVPANCYFIRISVRTDTYGYKPETLQAEGGIAVTSFELYKEIVKDVNIPEVSRIKNNSITESMIKNGSVTPYITSFFEIGKNRFDINDPDAIVGRYASNGSYVNDSSYKLTGYISVTPSEELRVSSLLLSSSATTEVLPYSLMYLDANKAVISVEAFNNTAPFRTVPANCYFIRISVRTDTYGYSWDMLQVESGTTITDYDTFYPKIKAEHLKVGTASVDKGAIDKSKLAEDVNPLAGKTLLNLGDSIAAGDGTNLDGTGNKGYAQIIASENGMVLKNYASSGDTVEVATGYESIVTQVNNAIAAGETPDYILFDGGTNSATGSLNGTITSIYENVTFDTATFCGAFEYICKALMTNFIGAKILYIRVHKMSTRGAETEARHDLALQMCEKWSIPYVDMFVEGGLNTKLEEHRLAFAQGGETGGATHPNEAGYRKYYVPRIEAKMKAI